MSETKTQVAVLLVAYFILTVVMMAATPESTGTILRSVGLAYFTFPIHFAIKWMWSKKFTKGGISFLVDLFLVILPKYFFIPFGIYLLAMGISVGSPYLHPVYVICEGIQIVVGGALVAFGHGLYSLIHDGRLDLWFICLLVEFVINRFFSIPKKAEEERVAFARYKAGQERDPYVHNDRIRVLEDDDFLRLETGKPQQLPRRSTGGTTYV